MTKLIDFLTVSNPYNSTYLFTNSLKKAFEDYGFNTRLLSFEEEDVAFSCSQFLKQTPDLLCSFNYICMKGGHVSENSNAIDKNRDFFLSSYLNVPQFNYFVDSPVYQMHLFDEPLNFCSVVDKYDFMGLESLKKKVLFLPHAVDKKIDRNKKDKVFDIVMTASFLDYEARMSSWQQRFDKKTEVKLFQAFEEVLKDKTKPIILAFNKVFEGEYSYPYNDLYYEVEYCIKGQDRLELLQLLKEFKIDVFGMSTGESSWQKKLKGSSHIVCHPWLSYKESLEVFKQAKVVLNSSPQFPMGSHERIFNALVSEAFVVTNTNSFILEEFGNDGGIIYFGNNIEKKDLVERVKEALFSENSHKKIHESQEILLKKHTWHHRAEKIIKYLNW